MYEYFTILAAGLPYAALVLTTALMLEVAA